jgi:hypothetical protein
VYEAQVGEHELLETMEEQYEVRQEAWTSGWLNRQKRRRATG